MEDVRGDSLWEPRRCESSSCIESFRAWVSTPQPPVRHADAVNDRECAGASQMGWDDGIVNMCGLSVVIPAEAGIHAVDALSNPIFSTYLECRDDLTMLTGQNVSQSL